LRSARAVGEARRGGALGVHVSGVNVDFPVVMRRMRERRADLSPNDSAARLRAAGVDVYFGDARFSGPSAVMVGDRTLSFWRAVVATGGRPAVPPVPGLSSVPFLTNETLFSLDERPRRLAILGAGSIGCEMAQAFARLGSQVTLVDHEARVLPHEDADASAILQQHLTADGVVLCLRAKVAEVSLAADGIRLRLEDGTVVGCDALLVATGRVPNVEGLDLAAAGVDTDKAGVVVDDRLRTTNRRVFAAGDVCSPFKFTHAADAMARIAVQNALFFGRARVGQLVMPWCTYTEPEVAHVGAYEEAARRDGLQVETITIPLADLDRAVVDEECDGFVRVHHDRGRLLGCTVVSSRAGEMIAVATDALMRGATLNDLAATIHPYPTQTAAFRAAGDAYRRTRLTPRIRAVLKRYFRLV
jgi:pyruvate/2-oxoglutarate dehydrogenase complex dihydrolipoamide dehydrogenase (E3) component